MDLSFFIDKNNRHIVGDIQDSIGLYIVNQSLLPKMYTHIWRAGAAGTKELINGEAGNKMSSF